MANARKSNRKSDTYGRSLAFLGSTSKDVVGDSLPLFLPLPPSQARKEVNHAGAKKAFPRSNQKGGYKNSHTHKRGSFPGRNLLFRISSQPAPPPYYEQRRRPTKASKTKDPANQPSLSYFSPGLVFASPSLSLSPPLS